ncbi:hypothetical protein [Botrimarina sp.]|uniref:hypothetical protein n=1 Tax=Botrimarina sp. TaxID=2795802 RepID=UPI0032EC740D
MPYTWTANEMRNVQWNEWWGQALPQECVIAPGVRNVLWRLFARESEDWRMPKKEGEFGEPNAIEILCDGQTHIAAMQSRTAGDMWLDLFVGERFPIEDDSRGKLVSYLEV